MRRAINWPRRLELLPEVAVELEIRGIEPWPTRKMRTPSFGGVGTERDTLYKFGNVVVRRGEVEDWLRWKAAVDGLWMKIDAIADVIGAVAK